MISRTRSSARRATAISIGKFGGIRGSHTIHLTLKLIFLLCLCPVDSLDDALV